MFGNITDDEDTFLPTSSNLASLFGVTNTSTDNALSLTYTAPKQPTTNKVGEPKPNRVQSSLITFKEVHAFKLIDKNYMSLGRCGFAFIGNESIKAYQLLIYKQKNDIICSVKFSHEFHFNERADNYATFLDDEKINWTVHFATDADLKEFSQAIKSHGGKITKNIDTKNVTTPLTKNIATSTMVETKNTSTGISQQQKPKENKDTDIEEFMNKIDSEFSDSSNSNAKATLLSRMAKMGQKLLPNNNISDGTDSDTEKERNKTIPNRRTKRIGASGTTTTPLSDIHPSKSEINKTLPISLPSSTQAYTFMNGQYVPIIQSQFMQPPPFHNQIPVENVSSPIMYSLPSQQQPSVDQLQMYFTENRTHNSEVRMNILRLTDKMEQVLSKINTYEQPSKTVETPEIVEALKKENEKLKTSIEKLQKQIERYKELEKKHTELLEQQIPLLKSNDEMKNVIGTHAQSEVKYLTKITELEAVVSKQKDDLKQYELNTREKVDIDETIKKLLNSLYSDISNQIGDDDTIIGRDIKKMLAQKFVDNAYSIIAVVSGDTSSIREKSETFE